MIPHGWVRGAVLLMATALVASTTSATPAQAGTDAPVVLIMLENHSFGANDQGVNGRSTKYVVGNTVDAPYLNGTLIPSGALFTNYRANFHPSLPDYLEFSAGTDGGCSVDSCPTNSIPDENLFNLLGRAGIPFASFVESMPANCGAANVAPYYLVRHNAEPYFTDISASSGVAWNCASTDVAIPAATAPGTPLSWPNPLPAFSYVAPNSCDDMHGTGAAGICPSNTDAIIAAGDRWLQANVPALLAEGAVVIVSFDEGAGTDRSGGGGHVATVVSGPNVTSGTTDPRAYNHASLLGGLENYFGLAPLLGDAATVAPLPIPRGTPYLAPSISGLAPEDGTAGDHVTITGSGLTDAFAVTFGGVAATFSAQSDTSIDATVPTEALSGPVTVSTIAGTASSPDIFTITGGLPPPTLVQHAAATGTKAAQASVALPQMSTTGNLLVATLGWSGGATVNAPSGWSLAVSSGGGAIYYRENAPAQGGPVTFSLSQSANWVLALSEWSGLAPSGSLDRTAHAGSGSAAQVTASSGVTAPTSQPVELAVAGIKALATSAESSPTNGFAQLDRMSAGTNDTLGTFWRMTSVTGTQGTSVSLTPSALWRGVIATFR